MSYIWVCHIFWCATTLYYFLDFDLGHKACLLQGRVSDDWAIPKMGSFFNNDDDDDSNSINNNIINLDKSVVMVALASAQCSFVRAINPLRVDSRNTCCE